MGYKLCEISTNSHFSATATYIEHASDIPKYSITMLLENVFSGYLRILNILMSLLSNLVR